MTQGRLLQVSPSDTMGGVGSPGNGGRQPQEGRRHVTSETSGHLVDGDLAMWMGRVTMTDNQGQITKVDKSFGYKRDAEGRLRIVLHHSSLPYEPSAMAEEPGGLVRAYLVR